MRMVLIGTLRAAARFVTMTDTKTILSPIKHLAIGTASALALIACSGSADAPQGTKTIASSSTDAENSAANMADSDSDNDNDAAMASDVNAPFNSFLKSYLSKSGNLTVVDYASVSDADHQALETYIDTLSGMDPTSMSDNEALAFWFNLYNAKTVDVILDNYPVDSIRDIDGGPWDEKILTVNGQAMSLDDIEHDTVRATYNEPRIHYAFNCASVGCPDLKMTAWEAGTLDADLTQAARAYISSDRGVSVDSDGDITASKIFDWYDEDFGGDEAGILAHLRQYSSGSKQAALNAADDIDDYEYDWSLNAPDK